LRRIGYGVIDKSAGSGLRTAISFGAHLLELRNGLLGLGFSDGLDLANPCLLGGGLVDDPARWRWRLYKAWPAVSEEQAASQRRSLRRVFRAKFRRGVLCYPNTAASSHFWGGPKVAPTTVPFSPIGRGGRRSCSRTPPGARRHRGGRRDATESRRRVFSRKQPTLETPSRNAGPTPATQNNPAISTITRSSFPPGQSRSQNRGLLPGSGACHVKTDASPPRSYRHRQIKRTSHRLCSHRGPPSRVAWH
jgi:hypothetical protein